MNQVSTLWRGWQREIDKISNWKEYASFCAHHLTTQSQGARMHGRLQEIWGDSDASREEGKRLLAEKMAIIFNELLVFSQKTKKMAAPIFQEYSSTPKDVLLEEKKYQRLKFLFPNLRRFSLSNQQEGTLKIVHGGSLRYIMDFLKGSEIGYNLEIPNEDSVPHNKRKISDTFNNRKTVGLGKAKGIQVHPLDKDDHLQERKLKASKSYATYKSKYYQDFPAILTGEIQSRYLDLADISHEAGLRSCYVSQLKNVNIAIVGHMKRDDSMEQGSLEEVNWVKEKQKAQHIPSDILRRYVKDFSNHLNYLDLELKKV